MLVYARYQVLQCSELALEWIGNPTIRAQDRVVREIAQFIGGYRNSVVVNSPGNHRVEHRAERFCPQRVERVYSDAEVARCCSDNGQGRIDVLEAGVYVSKRHGKIFRMVLLEGECDLQAVLLVTLSPSVGHG